VKSFVRFHHKKQAKKIPLQNAARELEKLGALPTQPN
jgi:hypothetical protein